MVRDQSQNYLIKCVITDESMDYMNGSEAIKILKNLEKYNKISPVVLAIISSYDRNYLSKNLGNIESLYFLPKPCNEKHLAIFFEKYKLFIGNTKY